MKLSIRVKLVALLVAVALLPLVAAMLTIAIGGRKLRSDSIAHSFQSVAVSEGVVFQVSLTKDIEKLLLALHENFVFSALAEVKASSSLSDLAKLDEAWATMPLDDKRMAKVLENEAAEVLERILYENPHFAEILLTDRFGQLFAATGRTTDYYQADEPWWVGVKGEDGPRIFIPPVDYDASTRVWSIDLCVPIVQEGRLLGIAKAVLDLSRWMRSIKATVGDVKPWVMFVRSDGTIIYREGTEPLSAQATGWHGAIAAGLKPGWRRTMDGQIQAFAPIRLPERINEYEVVTPKWSLVLFISEAEALGAVVRLSVVVLAIGLVLILFIFLLGIFLVDRVVVRRIYRLRGAARAIAQGDLNHRVELVSGGEVWGPDEIDELSEDFNNMVERVQRSHETLTAADQLKVDFIRIAGHELRTPVSYILGTVRLLKESRDPDRLVQAIQTMGSKAKQLDEIINAMFKLLPDEQGGEELTYEPIKVTELLEEVYLDCFPFTQQRSQRLIVEGAERIPSIEADRIKLRDVLVNLVMNAIKFTPDGGTVKVKVGRQLGEYVSFTVQDQGPGIPDSELPHIFKPFYSGGDVMKHSTGRAGYEKKGMGLGLAIVKHFVDLHEGTISVSSQPHGCVFRVTIPINRPMGIARAGV